MAEVHWVLLCVKLVGLTTSFGAGGGLQFHATETVLLFSPTKVKVLLLQALLGTKMLTVVEPPGESVPPAGLKVTPLRAVWTDQGRLPCELAVSLTVALHVQPPVPVGQVLPAVKVVGVTVSVGLPQLQGTWTVLAGPLKLKVKLAGHTLFGTEIVTEAFPPVGRTPLAGVKIIPGLLEADHARFLARASPRLRVAVQLQP